MANNSWCARITSLVSNVQLQKEADNDAINIMQLLA
jgi:hypothetical protein